MTTKFKPFFSVIIPTYNRREYLERAIRSVLKQNEKDFELIVVNDGSTDGTEEYLKYLKNEYKTDQLVILKQENEGVSSARNLGVIKSRGEWVAFLDSDDEWHKKKLQIQKKYLNENQQVIWCHGNERWMRNGSHLNQKEVHKKEGGDIFLRSLELCLISPSTVVINREVFLAFDGFDESFVVCEDYDLWLRILNKYPIGFCPEVLITKFGGHEDQLSRKYKAMDYYRVKSMYSILKDIDKVERLEVIKNEITKKCRILISGYKKFNNLENLKEVEGILYEVTN
jgi:GT2 family glycosyltransferase